LDSLRIERLKHLLLLPAQRLKQLFGHLALDLKVFVGGRGVDLLHALLLLGREPNLCLDLRNR
jgi:hypothetical protein